MTIQCPKCVNDFCAFLFLDLIFSYSFFYSQFKNRKTIKSHSRKVLESHTIPTDNLVAAYWSGTVHLNRKWPKHQAVTNVEDLKLESLSECDNRLTSNHFLSLILVNFFCPLNRFIDSPTIYSSKFNCNSFQHDELLKLQIWLFKKGLHYSFFYEQIYSSYLIKR